MRHLAVVALALAACDPVAWTTPVSGESRMLLSVWGDGARDVFVSGGSLGGTPPAVVDHFDGDRWTDLAPPTQSTLWWVFGLSASDLWVVGEQGTALHWDGHAFTSFPTGTQATLFGVWGAAHDDLWAVGGVPDASSVAIHFDGVRWSPATLPPLGGSFFKVWGTSARDVFVVGQLATILHYDGSAWTPMTSGLTKSTALLTIAGRAPNDVYAVGGQGIAVALHFDGSAWAPVANLDVSGASGLTGVSVTAAGDVSITGLEGAKFRTANGKWVDDSLISTQADLHGTWLAGPEDIFAVGGNLNAATGLSHQGVVAHYGHTIASK